MPKSLNCKKNQLIENSKNQNYYYLQPNLSFYLSLSFFVFLNIKVYKINTVREPRFLNA